MMGATGTRFGRNVPLTEAVPDTANLLNPNPRDISNALFTRTKFQPATILNVLAAAWIQFQVHDWFVHAKGTSDDTHNLPLADGDSWFERPMRVPKTPVDPPTVANSNRPPAYVNKNSHWWDGSNIYGSTKAEQDILRTGKDGKIKVQDDGRLFFDETTGTEITGSRDNLWVGLSLLHSLFAREHNAICDMLKAEHADWDDQRLFQQARLINVGADGQDPHDRVDAGHPAAPAAGARAQHQLARPAARAAEGVPQPGGQRSRSAAFPGRRPITTRRPTRSPRSSRRCTACTRCCRTTSRSAR